LVSPPQKKSKRRRTPVSRRIAIAKVLQGRIPCQTSVTGSKVSLS
jgi:hypothetical protein